jgi:hypothetical protein
MRYGQEKRPRKGAYKGMEAYAIQEKDYIGAGEEEEQQPRGGTTMN